MGVFVDRDCKFEKRQQLPITLPCGRRAWWRTRTRVELSASALRGARLEVLADAERIAVGYEQRLTLRRPELLCLSLALKAAPRALEMDARP